MNHETVQNDVMALLDGQLDAARRPAVEAHLRDCATCRAFADSWTEASALLRVPEPAPSDRFIWSVMSRVRQVSAERPTGVWDSVVRWLAPLSAAAAFAGYVALVSAPAADAPSAADAVLLSEARAQMPSMGLVSADEALQDHVLAEVEDI
jgi:anti-sigma factor RsiW